MKSTLLVLLAISSFSATFAMVTPTETFSESVSLVKDDVYHLFWKSDNTSVTFEVHAKVKGWVGFGLSPNGGMPNSDIVIGWVKDGVSYFKVRHLSIYVFDFQVFQRGEIPVRFTKGQFPTDRKNMFLNP